MKVIIAGLGSIGQRHARNLCHLGVTSLLGVDPDEKRQQFFAKEFDADTFSDVSEAASKGAELAVIASPNRFHIEQALICAKANCHLFIEKPLGTSLEDVDELIKLIESKKLFAHVGSNWKFQIAFRKMRELIEKGCLGSVTGVQVLAGQWLPDWHPHEDYRQGYSARRDLGGGIVLDSHEIDCITWLLGDVTDIQGFSARSGRLEVETEDVACASLRMASGALGTVHIDYIQRKPARRYTISGDGGSLEWDLYSESVKLHQAGVDQVEVIPTPLGDVNGMYVEQMRHVLDGLAGKTAPVTSLKSARRTLELQLYLRDQID